MTQEIFIANPYVGPRTFSYEQRHLFFGREREGRDLLARVLSERLLLFYAPSGAGKSSLLHTRLIPRLQEEKGFVVLPVGRVSGELPAGIDHVDNIYAFNLMLSIEEGDDPARLAHVTLSNFLARLVRTTEVDTAGQSRQAWVFDAAQAPGAGSGRYALIVDQFEDIITSHPARWQEREAFFTQLEQAMATDANLWVVLTLREDYVAALDPYASLMADRLRARFYMERMGVVAALDAIRKPAAVGGHPFGRGVAEKLVDDLRQVRLPGQEATVPGQYVEPVQLQVVCFQLWENLGKGTEGAEITFEDLGEAGDVNRALTQFYEETLRLVLADPIVEGVSEQELRSWFDTKLITEAGTRGLVHRGEARTGGLPNAILRTLQGRFLVRTEVRSGGTWIELVHDRFVEPIRESNQAWFEQHLSVLQRQALLWQREGRPGGLLLRGEALEEAEGWAQMRALKDHEKEFLLACRRAAQEERAREQRLNQTIRVLAAVATVVAILALIAFADAARENDRALAAELEAMKAAAERATAAAAAETAAGDAQAAALTAAAESADRATAQFEAVIAAKEALNQKATAEAYSTIAAARSTIAAGALATTMANVKLALTFQAPGAMPQVSATPPTTPKPEQPGPPNRPTSTPTPLQSPTPNLTVIALETQLAQIQATSTILATKVEFHVGQARVRDPIEMELVHVPAGAFLMGSDPAKDLLADSYEQRQHPVTLDQFYIGKYEVTNRQYEVFVNAAEHRAPVSWPGGERPLGLADHPVVHVSWDDALDFTEWLSQETGWTFRLCTEAEWEKACRGTEGFIYPWGNTFITARANTSASLIGTTTQVGSFSPQGDSPYRVADMAGNVGEWCSSAYKDYPYNAEDGREDLTNNRERVVRGGSFDAKPSSARCAARKDSRPVVADISRGFRVCMSSE